METTGEGEVSSREIGVLAMEMLSNLDIVAYIRFASVYYNFEKKEDFSKFIDTIKKEVLQYDDGDEILEKSYDKCQINPDFNPIKKDELF